MMRIDSSFIDQPFAYSPQAELKRLCLSGEILSQFYKILQHALALDIDFVNKSALTSDKPITLSGPFRLIAIRPSPSLKNSHFTIISDLLGVSFVHRGPNTTILIKRIRTNFGPSGGGDPIVPIRSFSKAIPSATTRTPEYAGARDLALLTLTAAMSLKRVEAIRYVAAMWTLEARLREIVTSTLGSLQNSLRLFTLESSLSIRVTKRKIVLALNRLMTRSAVHFLSRVEPVSSSRNTPLLTDENIEARTSTKHASIENQSGRWSICGQVSLRETNSNFERDLFDSYIKFLPSLINPSSDTSWTTKYLREKCKFYFYKFDPKTNVEKRSFVVLLNDRKQQYTEVVVHAPSAPEVGELSIDLLICAAISDAYASKPRPVFVKSFGRVPFDEADGASNRNALATWRRIFKLKRILTSQVASEYNRPNCVEIALNTHAQKVISEYYAAASDRFSKEHDRKDIYIWRELAYLIGLENGSPELSIIIRKLD